MTKAIVVFSGGKDSTVALWWAMRNYDVVEALSIDHPTRPARERDAADHIAQVAGVLIHSLPLSFLRPVRELIGERHDSYVTRTAYIPMRNLIYFEVAAYFAEARVAEAVVAGQRASDGTAYLDATETYLRSIEALARDAMSASFLEHDSSTLRFVFPLINLSDRDAMTLGRSLGAPLELSWSCLEDAIEPCQQCISCFDRSNALSES